MPSRLARLIRSRLAWPVAIMVASLTVLTSETAYRVARTSAAEAVEINTARWSIHRLQLAAADLDSTWRGVVLTGDDSFRAHFGEVRESIEKELNGLRPRYRAGDAPARRDFDRLERVYADRIDDMVRAIELRDRGGVDQGRPLLELGLPHRLLADAEATASALLDREVGELREERHHFFEALTFGRWGVIGMTLVALVAVGSFRHAALRLQRQREEQRVALEGEREQLESTVAQRTRELRALARHLQTAVENERALLARELHDELGALLTAAKLDVARLKSKLPRGHDLDDRLAHLEAMLADGITLKRRIIEDLRPSALNNLGLVPALEMLVRQTQERLSIPVRAELVPVETTAESALTIYRFVQEALTNVARHARAHRVRVSLREAEGDTIVEVHDDGVGFEPARAGLGAQGLSGMRFRVESLGGQLSLRSAPGDTLVMATIPIVAKTAPGRESAGEAELRR